MRGGVREGLGEQGVSLDVEAHRGRYVGAGGGRQ